MVNRVKKLILNIFLEYVSYASFSSFIFVTKRKFPLIKLFSFLKRKWLRSEINDKIVGFID